ncbi:zwei Ig domain protein zig-8-like isoform X2, partial [Vespula squamosa]
ILATANWIDNANVRHGGFMVRRHVEKTMNLVSDPNFKEPIANVTAPVGREAILSCVVQDLAGYKVI